MPDRFLDRADAGRRLAGRLVEWADRGDVTVLALPRGGVPVGYEVAQRLHAPLDVFTVRKLGLPAEPELAMGAIASGGIRVLNRDVVDALGIDAGTLDRVTEREALELGRREAAYRPGRGPPDVRGRVVILVDDGIATGSTMIAAVRATRSLGPARVIVAVPVAPPSARAQLGTEADAFVCLHEPPAFFAIGAYYDDFGETSDEQVRALLASAARPSQGAGSGATPAAGPA
jgi:putative phosphoribosyl transferase